MTQAMPTRMPPNSTTGLGPKRSTSQPSIGTSQVSVMTKMLKATWMAARPQWYLASMGLTKSVQPYCRFAIIAMQTMPRNSCSQRFAGRACDAADATEDMRTPPELRTDGNADVVVHPGDPDAALARGLVTLGSYTFSSQTVVESACAWP